MSCSHTPQTCGLVISSCPLPKAAAAQEGAGGDHQGNGEGCNCSCIKDAVIPLLLLQSCERVLSKTNWLF